MKNMRGPREQGNQPSGLVAIVVLGIGALMYMQQEGMTLQTLMAKFQSKAVNIVSQDSKQVEKQEVKSEPTHIFVHRNKPAYDSVGSKRTIGIIESGVELPILELRGGKNSTWIKTRSNGLVVWISSKNVEFK